MSENQKKPLPIDRYFLDMIIYVDSFSLEGDTAKIVVLYSVADEDEYETYHQIILKDVIYYEYWRDPEEFDEGFSPLDVFLEPYSETEYKKHFPTKGSENAWLLQFIGGLTHIVAGFKECEVISPYYTQKISHKVKGGTEETESRGKARMVAMIHSLSTLGFKETSASHSYNYGDVTLKNDDFNLRLIRNGADSGFYIIKNDGPWFGLPSIKIFLTQPAVLDAKIPGEEQVQFLIDRYDDIKALFSDANYKLTELLLQTIAELRWKKVLEKETKSRENSEKTSGPESFDLPKN